MSRTYEVWDSATRNLVGAYGSEAEALTFVRAYTAEHGSTYVSSWILLWDDDAADAAGQVAEGHALLALAGASQEAPRPSPKVQSRRAS